MILVKSHSLEHATASKIALGDRVSIIHCQGRMTFKEVLLSSALTALAVKLEDDSD